MKLLDQIQPIAQRAEYSEFAELWRGFLDTGRMRAGHAHRMIQLGFELHRYACVATALSGIEPSEEEFGEAVAQAMPELAAFLDFTDRTMLPRRTPVVEA